MDIPKKDAKKEDTNISPLLYVCKLLSKAIKCPKLKTNLGNNYDRVRNTKAGEGKDNKTCHR